MVKFHLVLRLQHETPQLYFFKLTLFYSTKIKFPLSNYHKIIYFFPILGIVMGGVLPFGCIFIQLFFVLNSIWSSQIYYMYGFLFLVFVILIITCSETTILLCYFHLCAEVSSPKTEVWTLFPKFFTANILFWKYLGVICFRPKNQSFL